MIRNEHVDSWTKKSWMDEFLSSPRLATDLTSRYAEDIIQAVEDKEFNSLDDAIAELKTRVNLTASETSDLKKRVLASTDPSVFIAVENIKKLSKSQLGDIIKLATEVCDKCEQAPCECTAKLSSVASKAINFVGLEALAELFDAATEAPAAVEAPAVTEAPAAEAPVELTAEASKLQALMADGVSATEALETVAKGMPEGLKKYLDKKNGTEDKGEEVSKEEKKDDKEAEASLKAQAEKWGNYLSKQSWFQGAEEASKEGNITSNDPNKLGYPKEVEYSHTELNPPVGDVRQWEQKEFEGAAAETAKVLGPSGSELELKKMWQRARYMAAIRKANKTKK